MGSLISDSDKVNIGNVFNDMHDTFAQPVTVFQQENAIFVSTNSTYNALYGRLNNQQTTRSKVTQTTVQARILYRQDQKEIDLPGTRAQVNVPLGEGVVRVKIDPAGYELFKLYFYTLYLRQAD